MVGDRGGEQRQARALLTMRQPSDRVFELAYSFRQTRVLVSALELGVFAELQRAPANEEELRGRLGLHPRGARDFLDALVGLGLLERDAGGIYANAPTASRHLVPGEPGYLGGLVAYVTAAEYPGWNGLTGALRSGRPADRPGAGDDLYATLYANPDAVDQFTRAMSAATLPVAEALAEAFPWRECRTVVDVGCAEGCLPVTLALRHPHISGGGFDLPAVRPAFERYVRIHGLARRLIFHGGDFLRDELPSAEVLVLGRVLHNWNLATKRLIIGKAHAALPPDGALIVYDRMIDDERRSAPALLASLNMLVMTEGGFDFSATQCTEWLAEAGFRDLESAPLAAGQSMVVGRR